MKRRDFLKTGIISGGLGIASTLTGACTTSPAKDETGSSMRDPAAAPNSTIFVRHEVSSPEAAKDLETYAQAITIMKDPSKNPVSVMLDGKKNPNGYAWERHAEIHLNFCPHGTWKFFPWHRDYLLRFEAIIRKVTNTPTFCLPYWDWTNNPDLPAMFMKPQSPLFMDEESRKKDISKAVETQCSSQILSAIMKTSDFESFMGSEKASGEIEYGPHNGVHVALGDTMATFRSPLDPIFWLHHCNVDRLWAEWQEKNSQWMNAQEIGDKFPKYLEQKLGGFYDTSGRPVGSATNTAREMLDTYRNSYCYDTTIRTQRQAGFTFFENKEKAQRAPAAARSTYKVKAFTRDDIKTVIEPNQGSTAFRVSFPEFRTNVVMFLDQYLQDPPSASNLQYRLKVSGMPKVSGRTFMQISFDGVKDANIRNSGGFFISNYAFFSEDPTDQKFSKNFANQANAEAQENHHHGGDLYVPDFNWDYKKLLIRMQAKNIFPYPDDTTFVIKFLDALTRKPISVKGLDFSKLSFKLVILERTAI
jgi:hypothetical protein